MTTIDVDTTLARVVTEHPRLARELERRGLDYCCRGERTVAEASQAAGLDPGTVVNELVHKEDNLLFPAVVGHELVAEAGVVDDMPASSARRPA